MATKKSTALVNYDAEFAQAALAAQSRAQKASGTAKTIKTKAGILMVDGAQVPGNQLIAIVVEDLPAKGYYDGAYVEGQGSSPCCFAFQDDDLDAPMRPHSESLKPQHDICATCPKNAYGSAIKADGTPGKGKACKDGRRLIVMGAGVVEKGQLKLFDEDTLRKQPLYQLTTPATSCPIWDSYVKQIATMYGRPPYAVLTRISARPHVSNQFEIIHEYLGNIPNELVAAVLSRRDEAVALARQPYSPPIDRPAAAPAAKKSTKKGASY